MFIKKGVVGGKRKQPRLSKFYGGLKVGLALVSTIYIVAMVAIATAQTTVTD